jgi:hypothetical protein
VKIGDLIQKDEGLAEAFLIRLLHQLEKHPSGSGAAGSRPGRLHRRYAEKYCTVDSRVRRV